MNAQIEVSYDNETHDKFEIKDRESYSVDMFEGIKTLTIYPVDKTVVEINWDKVKKIGYFPGLTMKGEELQLGALEQV